MTDVGLAVDVAAASAAHLVNLLPALMALDPAERYARLRAHLEGSLIAYRDLAGGFHAPSPSAN